MEKFEKKVSVIISIRDNTTGEVVHFPDDEILTEEGFNLERWTEGEHSCDCNRELFFNNHHAKVMLKHEEKKIHKSCGLGKYFVNVVNKETQEVYFQQHPITEIQKIKEHVYKELFTDLFKSIPKINLDLMILQGEYKPNTFLFRNKSVYENTSCKMTVQFDFQQHKG